MIEQELREKIVNTITNLNNICRKGCVCKDCKYENYDNCTEYAIADALIANKFGRIINFAEYVGSKIAGHSNYHGDSILCALYCAAEGKEIHNVKPLDITEYGYNVLVKERDEYKRHAEVAEKALDKATELAYTYRTQDDTLSCSSCPFDSIFDRCKERGLYEDCSKRWKEELLQQAEKELAEDKKDD